MKKFFEEFKKFITRGNIIDMSVGVIVGGAFTSIVNALSNNILKPLINWILALILGSNSLSGIYTYLTKVTVKDEATGEEVVDLAQSIYIDWGAFVNAIINFLIIAFVLFSIVKFINALSDQKAKMNDMKFKIERKQAKGKKLNKKELAFLEAEAKRLAEEEQKKLELEEAERNKVTTESLLSEIRDLLKTR
jgi:large conductance mechanosensitive channel